MQKFLAINLQKESMQFCAHFWQDIYIHFFPNKNVIFFVGPAVKKPRPTLISRQTSVAEIDSIEKHRLEGVI